MSLPFSPFWQKQSFNISDVLHKENYYLAYLFSNFNLDAVDFSERHSEEVIRCF